VTIAFDNWKDGAVASTEHEIPVVAPRLRNIKLEAVSSRLKGELIHPNKTRGLFNLKFSPDGKRLLAGDYPAGLVIVWDCSSGKRLTTIETHSRFFAVSPDWRKLFAGHETKREHEYTERDGKRLIRWSFDAEVRVWSIEDGKLIRSYKHNPPRGIRSIQLSPDATRFITKDELSGTYERVYDSARSIWDCKSGEYKTLNEQLGYGTISSDGRYFATAVQNAENIYTRARKLSDLATGEEKWSVEEEQKLSSTHVDSFSRDGRIVFGSLRIFDHPKNWDAHRTWMKWWDAGTGREIASFEVEKNDGFINYQSSPDGQILAVLNWGKGHRKLFLYSIAERRLLRTVMIGEKVEGHDTIASGLTFHPSGRWLAVATRVWPEKSDGNDLDPRDVPQPRILLIETATGTIRETIISPQAFTNWACFSPDGRTLATDGVGRVLLWDMTKMPE
jgi:WD40 repeat protein